MQIRVVRLNARNPLVAVALIVIVLAILALVVTAGVALLAGAAILGGGALLARRAFGKRLGAPGASRARPLGQEVFPPEVVDADRRLPPGA